MKRKIPGVLFLILLSPFFLYAEQSFGLSLFPGAALSLGKDEPFDSGFSLGLSGDWNFLPFMGLSLGGGGTGVSVKDQSTLLFLEGRGGVFFQHSFGDRFTLRAEGNGGLYNVRWEERTTTRLRFGTALSGGWNLSPSLSLFLYGGYTWYDGIPSPFMQTLNAGVGIRLNLSELLRKENRVKAEKTVQNMVFPVSYAWYENNPVATVQITNNEPNAITAVNVSLYLEQYMNEPTLGAVIPRLNPGETAEVPVTALFNESMLDLTGNINAHARLIIDYLSLGSRRQADVPMGIPIYDRNAMTWDDDRRAASFVSPRDPAATLFARYVGAMVERRMRPNTPGNIQYALGFFEALNAYGINYIIDPSSSYAKMSESAVNLDSLNYPYQTLFYRGGDCDDLSILFCSLLEVMGIDTAFITVPGHIYMAFDSGMDEEEGRRYFASHGINAADGFIYHHGRSWVPLEITIPAEGYYRAWRIGAQEWNDAGDERAIFPMKDSWTFYPPVSVPDVAEKTITLPVEDLIGSAFENAMNIYESYFIRNEVKKIQNEFAAEGVELHRRLGVLYARYGMMENAKAEFSLVRGNSGRLNLAQIAFVEGEYRMALDMYEALLEAEPGNVPALLGKSRSLYNLGDLAGASLCWRELNGIDPALAAQYPYLKVFEETMGKPHSYSDRLRSALWIP
jgi:tetratricopeptide (TPR) repeat protein